MLLNKQHSAIVVCPLLAYSLNINANNTITNIVAIVIANLIRNAMIENNCFIRNCNSFTLEKLLNV